MKRWKDEKMENLIKKKEDVHLLHVLFFIGSNL